MEEAKSIIQHGLETWYWRGFYDGLFIGAVFTFSLGSCVLAYLVRK